MSFVIVGVHTGESGKSSCHKLLEFIARDK